MPYLNYIILGLVQGVTEFLPISSDGHLVLLGHWIQTPGDGIAVVIFLHAGSLAALLWAFRRDLLGIFRSPEPGQVGGPRLLGLLILATVPVVIVGPTLYSAFSAAFESSTLAAWMLIINGLILISTRASRVGNATVNVATALAMGCVQIFALLPGISRSALTMSTGFALGRDRVQVARFSFLMAVPAIAGANIYEIMKLDSMSGIEPLGLAIGIFTAFISGLIAIKALLLLVRRGRFEWFGVYCVLLGILFIILGI